MQDRLSVFDETEFANNPDPRCPVIVLADCSDSMTVTPPGESRSGLEGLNGGLDVLVSEIAKDELSRRRIELSVIGYGTDVSTPTPFKTVTDPDFVIPELSPMGITNTGKALNVALDALEERKRIYKEAGAEYYQPILMLISDGLSMDDLSSASARIKDLQSNKKLSFLPIGVQGADLSQMSTIGLRSALMLQGLKFDELFQWLSQSAASVSASNPGEDVMPPSPADWAVL